MKYSEFNEKKLHGIVDFPIQLYHVEQGHPQYIMPLHWHKEIEIIRIISGRLDLYINNILYRLDPGDIAFINCKALHRGEPTNSVYECIVCDLSMLIKKGNEIYSSYVGPVITGDSVISPVVHPRDTKLYEYINSLFIVMRNENDFYELHTIGLLFMIFEHLYKNKLITKIHLSKKSMSQNSLMAELVKWIDTNYPEQITLETLSELSKLSPNYLCKIFKEYTGKTPIEYVNTVRIDAVCHEIKWGEKNITEAAMDNGFNDISYFCKVFKKYKGISAKHYIKQYAEDAKTSQSTEMI